ncbi:hypothetical protein [Conexibacter woesei]|uniref:hypothetical protein n=1 Tax=Conexibacter woesei TaxID=191495 RepID=UPI000421EE29|nr:hypothetical protein [Conexibacter woesei]
MLHRSALLAILSAALLLPAAAHAVETVPAVVVAGPTASGATASAKVANAGVCISLALPDRIDPLDRSAAEQAGPCDPLRLGPEDEHGLVGFVAHDSDDPGHRTLFDAGATGTDIAAVELRKAGRTVAHVATQPSPLPSEPYVRFYLLESSDQPDEIAFLDASDTVRRAADIAGDGRGEHVDAGDRPIAGLRTLARGRGRGEGSWTLSAYRVSSIDSTPLAPERRLTQACVRLVLRGGSEVRDSGACNRPGTESQQLLPAFADDGCGDVGRYAGAFVRSQVARVVVTLGSGTRLTLPLRALPAAAGGAGLRFGMAVFDAHQAIRSMVAYDAAGRAIDRSLSTTPPEAPKPCAHGKPADDPAGELSSEDQSDVANSSANSARPTPLGAGPHQVQAADAGDLICLAADRAPRVPQDCAQPPTAPADASVGAVPTADGRIALSVVPAEIATARVTFDDGTRRDIPTVPIPGYGGQYAASLKLVYADLPGPHHILRYALLDARGQDLSDNYGPEVPGLGAAHEVGRVRGVGTLFSSPPVVAASLRYPAEGRGDCLTVGRPAAGAGILDQGCLPHYTSAVSITASCAPRQIVVSVGLTRRTDRVAIRLASGREVALRTYALPASRTEGFAAAQAIGVLGAHDVPRTLIRRGAVPKRLALALPAAAEQCGYRGYDMLDLPAGFSD